MSLFPYIELGNPKGDPLVFLSGFPDDQVSAFGPVLEEFKASYRVLSLCMPGNDVKAGSSWDKKWGYNFQELIKMLDNTIVHLLGKDQAFTFVVHDWGSILGMLYQNHHPDRVRKMVLFDVGMLSKLPPLDMLRIATYQFWFALSYLVSQLVNYTLGDILFKLYFVFTMILPFMNTIPYGVKPRTSKDIQVHMCYPYVHFWKAKITGDKFIVVKYPTCPILFMHGTKKNAQFHDAKFLQRIESSGGASKHFGLEAGHWVMHDQKNACVAKIRDFI